MLKAFQVKVNDKMLDYRLGKQLDLVKIRAFFEKRYKIQRLWSGGRHILGILEKNNKTLFLKLATTEGISAVTRNEYKWNEQFNKLVSRKSSNYWVPQNKGCGFYNKKLFYLLTDKFDGELLIKRAEKVKIPKVLINNIYSIIRFSELIQKLDSTNFSYQEDSNYKKLFLEKTKAWYTDIPKNIIEKYKVSDLLKIIENGILNLQKAPRHGDFTPWHLIKLKGRRLGLIDGEHAMENGIEYYDIGYFIQRVFSVLENPIFADKILSILIKCNYKIEKLNVILAARGIGGFLDESLKPSPNYTFSNRFKNWVIKLNKKAI